MNVNIVDSLFVFNFSKFSLNFANTVPAELHSKGINHPVANLYYMF